MKHSNLRDAKCPKCGTTLSIAFPVPMDKKAWGYQCGNVKCNLVVSRRAIEKVRKQLISDKTNN